MNKKIITLIVLIYLIAESVFGFTTFAIFPPSIQVTSITDTALKNDEDSLAYLQKGKNAEVADGHHWLSKIPNDINYADYKLVNLPIQITNSNWIRSMRDVRIYFIPSNNEGYLYYTNEAVMINVERFSDQQYTLTVLMKNSLYNDFKNKKVLGTLNLKWGLGLTKSFELNQVLNY
ncbi:hypothetical protein [Paenibacillus shenyangensis]|uniref:hypothetical protein n=1 Tax=Paenibacillus sp. A9 TaxID=1284352 RepID=UPI000377E3EA|nr:hypothetical protein [Paenibacillus sp. A9]